MEGKYMSDHHKFITIEKYNGFKANHKYFNLSFILEDLFNEASPIIKFKKTDNAAPTLIAQINSFMPEVVLQSFLQATQSNKANAQPQRAKIPKRKFDYYREFTNSSNTYTLGNKVIKIFNEIGIAAFVDALEKNENLIIDKALLKEYLKAIKELLFPDEGFFSSTNNKTYFKNSSDKYKQTYDIYLNHNNEINVLARLIISTIILQRQTKGCPHAKYVFSFIEAKAKKESKKTIENLLKAILDKIWLTFCDNPAENEIFRECVLRNYKKSDFNSVINISKLNKEILDKNENAATKHLYAVALLQSGNISDCEKVLNEKSFENYPDAQYLLYRIYNDDFGRFPAADKEEKRRRALAKAVDLCQPNAVLSAVSELINDFNSNYKTIENLLQKLNKKINALGDDLKADFYYYFACCKEKDNLPEEAKQYFDNALKYGNERARAKASRVLRKTNDFSKAFNSENYKNICVINSNNEATKVFLKSLSEDYLVFAINSDFSGTEIENIISLSSVKSCIDTLISKAAIDGKVIISFLNDDDRINLRYGLEVLDRLYNEALNKSRYDRISFINIFDIYIKSDYEYASVFVDANLSDMGCDIYFRTHIIDPYRNSVLKLLYEKPVFLPLLTNKENAKSGFVVIGNNVNFNFSIIKQFMAVSYMGNSVQASACVISDNEAINTLSNKLQKEMPGIYVNGFSNRLKEIIHHNNKNTKHKQPSEYPILKPELKSYDISRSEFFSLLLSTSAFDISDKELNDAFNLSVSNNFPIKDKSEVSKFYKLLNSANYFVVNVGTDEENIEFAINIRRSILANSPKMDKKPFIAVYCENPKTAYLASRITLSNKNQGDHYHNKYDLYFFGMADTLYTYSSLVDNALEKQALKIHESYFSHAVNKSDNEDTLKALNSYYSYQYNQDSSIISAIGLRYRLFIAGLYKDKNLSSEFTLEEDCGLSQEFNKYLNKKIKLKDDELAEIEQIRWNNYMLSRGWSAPAYEQLETYLKDNSVTTHKHMLLKLHPYIADWDDLDDDGDICKMIKDSNKEFYSPRETTRQSVKNTAKWLSMFRNRGIER